MFPEKISMFVDLFGGSGSVLLNANAEYYIYNDIVPYVKDILKGVKTESLEDILSYVKSLIKTYGLSKQNLIGFEQLRSDYNSGQKDWKFLYTLMCHSFNNQYRFNSSHQYNSSFGKHKSCFSPITENKLLNAHKKLQEMDVVFSSKHFSQFDFSDFDENDFVYCDPPYLGTIGNYNDGKRGFEGWNENLEKSLYKVLDDLNEKGCRFALSNDIVSNPLLDDWVKSKGYIVHQIDNSYGNSSYNKKDRGKECGEVLVVNYT